MEEESQVVEQEEVAEQVEETVEEGAEPEAEETAEEEEASAAPETEEPATIEGLKKAAIAERKKRQELEAQLKAREEAERAREEELRRRQAPQQESLEMAYLRNPEAFESYVEQKIIELTNQDPYGNAAEITRWQKTLFQTPIRAEQLRERLERDSNYQFLQTVERTIPDFQSKQKSLTDFAKSELGYDDETLATFSNPKVVGPKAAQKFIETVNKQFEARQAVANLGKKQVKSNPTRVEAPGTGIPPNKETLADLLRKGEDTGDFREYLIKAGLV